MEPIKSRDEMIVAFERKKDPFENDYENATFSGILRD